VISTEPPRVLVTVPHEGEELRLTVDGDLNVSEADGADGGERAVDGQAADGRNHTVVRADVPSITRPGVGHRR